MRSRLTKTSPGAAAASAAAALLFAGHIYLNLGDYTAERGLAAVAQVAAISSAFGAMVFLILETTLNALDRMFPGD